MAFQEVLESNKMKYLILILFVALSFAATAQVDKASEDYKTIQKLDSEFFEAYNTCTENLDKHASFYAEELEFFHDKGGLVTSKTDLIASIKKNICGKVTRELVPNSIELHEIPNYGFVQIGYHKFFNKEEPNAISKPSKFIVFWKYLNKELKVAKVVSLH